MVVKMILNKKQIESKKMKMQINKKKERKNQISY